MANDALCRGAKPSLTAGQAQNFGMLGVSYDAGFAKFFGQYGAFANKGFARRSSTLTRVCIRWALPCR